ncbi:MAG: exonuclease domain-containing protein [Rhodospirillales bacterium]
MDFVAIDVETANPDLASICQIGVASVQFGKIVDQWTTLVDPEDIFDPFNIAIHGIDEDRIKGAPTFADIYSEFQARVSAPVIVSHTSFDRVAITMAAEKYQLPAIAQVWLDSARVARRAWPDKYAVRGYGLANVAADLGINFKHHDAGEDARAAAEIILRACEVAALDLDGWVTRVQSPISPESTAPIRREGNPEGTLYGECLCFTGALQIPRREAADLAATSGCNVESGVTKKTTVLVVGDQDIQKLAGHAKSNKHRKAEALIEKGQPIRILRETDFKKLVLFD